MFSCSLLSPAGRPVCLPHTLWPTPGRAPLSQAAGFYCRDTLQDEPGARAEHIHASPANVDIAWIWDRQHLGCSVEFGALEVFWSFSFSPMAKFLCPSFWDTYAMCSLLFRAVKRNCLFDYEFPLFELPPP